MRDIIAHYDEVPEDDRLQADWGRLELARTQELILRHLPAPPRKILDVGGGSGVYSSWLGGLGYKTHLLDPVPRHVAQARQRSEITSCEVGDARSLSQASASFDAVLLLGPLYHLTEADDRLKALAEAHRVLRPGGVLFAAGISRFGSLLDGLVRGFVDDPRFIPILEQDLNSGQHRNATGDPNFFTTAFFHLPKELESEVAKAGFSVAELAAIEGPGWIAANFEERWSDPVRRQQLLRLIRMVEQEPSLLGLSPHLLVVAKRN
jgi:ubiquinone/menaquinone biosynthesis C-methylase UbiE